MRDILLHIDTYDEPTPPAAIEQAVAFAKLLGGKLSALATHIDIHIPKNWLAERLLHISELTQVEENKSLEAARASLKHFEFTARAADVLGEGAIVRASIRAIGDCIARNARTYDLCIVGTSTRLDSPRAIAEDIIFGAGRPVLVFNPEQAPLHVGALDRVAVLWDGSRCAARAASDSLPLLARARETRIVTVVGDKPSTVSGLSTDLVRHLKAHGVTAQVDEIDGAHRSIGHSIDAYVDEKEPQLMVMGGFGSSRMKEFILGGATQHVLNDLRVPTLFSH